MTIGSAIDVTAFERSVSHFEEVGGYLTKRAAEIFLLIHLFQRDRGVTGHILEIGTYEGRSTIFLTHLLSSDESLHVSDLFDQQELNVSQSLGVGFAPWERNVKRFTPGHMPLEIHRGPSKQLDKNALGRTFRIAYLDGGHSTDEVISDLTLADGILLDEGVAILDDTFRDDFPGTTEGLVRFVNENEGQLVPVLCFETKVLLVRPALHNSYTAMFVERTDTDESWFLPTQVLCGWEVLTIRFRGKWEMTSLRLRNRYPRAHEAISSSPLIGRLFHRARGAEND